MRTKLALAAALLAPALVGAQPTYTGCLSGNICLSYTSSTLTAFSITAPSFVGPSPLADPSAWPLCCTRYLGASDIGAVLFVGTLTGAPGFVNVSVYTPSLTPPPGTLDLRPYSVESVIPLAQVVTAPVPEPSSVLLLGAGLVALGFIFRKRAA